MTGVGAHADGIICIYHRCIYFSSLSIYSNRGIHPKTMILREFITEMQAGCNYVRGKSKPPTCEMVIVRINPKYMAALMQYTGCELGKH